MYTKTNELWPLGVAPTQAYCGEAERLSVLAAYGTNALVDDPELGDIVALAATICDAPMAMVTMVERERQMFLARQGLEASETPRDVSFCAHAMLGDTAMVVPDATLDPRFVDNPLVTGPLGIRFYAGQPLISAEGAPLGALCVIDTKPRSAGLTELQARTLETLGRAAMRRLSSQRQVEVYTAEQLVAQERVQQVLDSVPGIAWSADDELRFDYFNARWPEVTGAPAPTTIEEWASFIHPDDYGRSRAEFEATVAQGKSFEDEVRLRVTSGDWRWVLSRVVPIPESGGKLRWVGTLIDIDREHRQREANELLNNELSHRIKNIFAVISGLIAIRSRGRAEVADFAHELGAAVRSLGIAHDYVRPVEGRTSDRLQGLLGDLLAPYHDPSDTRVSITGQDIAIGARAATPLALVFHELATNSAKYGALSVSEGRVEIAIALPCGDEECVRVTWRETAVPGQEEMQPEHEGFGSRLLRMAVEGQLRGGFHRRFTDDGMFVEIEFPASAVTA